MSQSNFKPSPGNFLLDSGLLYQINRLIFHPQGLAMQVEVDQVGSTGTFSIWDYQNDPEGIVYDEKTLQHGAEKLINYMTTEGDERENTRLQTLGFIHQEPDNYREYLLRKGYIQGDASLLGSKDNAIDKLGAAVSMMQRAINDLLGPMVPDPEGEEGEECRKIWTEEYELDEDMVDLAEASLEEAKAAFDHIKQFKLIEARRAPKELGETGLVQDHLKSVPGL